MVNFEIGTVCILNFLLGLPGKFVMIYIFSDNYYVVQNWYSNQLVLLFEVTYIKYRLQNKLICWVNAFHCWLVNNTKLIFIMFSWCSRRRGDDVLSPLYIVAFEFNLLGQLTVIIGRQSTISSQNHEALKHSRIPHQSW